MKFRHFKAGLTALMFVLSNSCICGAQVPTKTTKGGKKTPALTATQQRALENLDRIALEARQIDNAAIRTDLQSLIGDALWDFDTANARNIFIDAFKNARNIEDKRKAAAVQTAVIKHIWTRDRALAETLMKQLADVDPQKTEAASGDFGLAAEFGMKSGDPSSQQKLELARSLLEDNSGAAAELIAASLQNEVNFAGINLLSQLRPKDPELANSIFRDALNQLTNLPTTGAVMAAIAMGNYVTPTCTLCSQTAPVSSLAGPYYQAGLQVLRRSVGQTYTPPPVRRDLQDRLVQYFHEMQALLALTLTRFAGPSDIPALESIYRQQSQTLEPSKQQKLQALQQMQKVTNKLDDLVDKAANVPDQEQRDKALFSLVTAAVRQRSVGDSLTDLEATVEKIQSKELHDKAWSLIKSGEVEQLIQTGQLDGAYTLASKLPDPTIRAKALRNVSRAVARNGSQVLRSSDVLAQALESLGKAEVAIETVQLMFNISSDLVNLKDYEGAFKALESSTQSLSKLKKTDFEQTNTEAVPFSLFDFRNTFGRLGNVDFDRTMFVAQTIKWREFRLAAEIAACRSMLNRQA